MMMQVICTLFKTKGTIYTIVLKTRMLLPSSTAPHKSPTPFLCFRSSVLVKVLPVCSCSFCWGDEERETDRQRGCAVVVVGARDVGQDQRHFISLT